MRALRHITASTCASLGFRFAHAAFTQLPVIDVSTLVDENSVSYRMLDLNCVRFPPPFLANLFGKA